VSTAGILLPAAAPPLVDSLAKSERGGPVSAKLFDLTGATGAELFFLRCYSPDLKLLDQPLPKRPPASGRQIDTPRGQGFAVA
jgi:hypothetical protein